MVIYKMGKIIEMESALKTKKEWKKYIDWIYEAGKINLDGYSKMCHAIDGSNMPEE